MAGCPIRPRQTVVTRLVNVGDEAMRHEGAFYFGRRLALVFRGFGGGVSKSRFTTSSNGIGLGLFAGVGCVFFFDDFI
jgi:hypothetical protein